MRSTEQAEADEGWLIRERSSGTFERTLTLPQGIEAELITADYTDGVLAIHIPQAVAAVKPTTHRVAVG